MSSPMLLPAVVGAAYAEANCGRWICRCPRPYCRSALQMEPAEAGFRCWECGAEARVVWPVNVADIETLLMMRPDWLHRSWLPGQSLHELVRENLELGIVPADGQALAVMGDRIVGDAIGPTRRRLGIEA